MTSLSCSNATGSLLATLFNDWPPENLLQISTIIPEDEITSSYTQYFRPKSGSNIPPPLGAIFHRTKFADLYCLNWKNLLNTVRQFEPDLLYTRIVGHPLFFTDIGCKLARNLKLPMACHIMDDYERLFAASPNPFERYIVKPIFAHRLREILNLSNLNFAISSKMAKAFSKRYKSHFISLHNGIDPSLWSSSKTKKTNTNIDRNIFRIVLAGSLAQEKEGAVAWPLAQAVNSLNSQGEDQYELVLNVQDCYLSFARRIAGKYEGIKVQGYLPTQAYRHLLQQTDLLVLARNFDKKSKAYTEYSFQNKLPEYMVSGTPILCIGPSWENSVQFLQNHSAGKVVTDANPEKIGAAIKELNSNAQKGRQYAEHARQIALSEFDIHRIRNNFIDHMCKLTT
ncbi:MAG: hypothetical protein ABFS18_14870 [Thermodesulfobacteriota bacterium]